MSRISSQRVFGALSWAAFALLIAAPQARGDDLAPKPGERQLSHAMHSAMSERPTVKVGRNSADIVGADDRALQAAVDYVAGLGGGVVNIGEGEYLMRDSLHLRSNVTVRGLKGKTVLRKADAAVSALALDGDFGEQQVTLKDPAGFDRVPASRSGMTTRGASTPRWRGSLGGTATPSRSTHRSWPTAWRRPRDGGHRFPGCQWSGYPGCARSRIW